ncbi:MAG: hypothetical protein K8R59_10810, partial [Thermoanaerobaculales bacterium]|nr:hypothetical protein [Thermoanaerobaculales bacterium]
VRLHDLDSARWRWRAANQPLADYLAALPRRARPGVAEAIERHAILMNRRSLFGDKVGAHYGIGASVYARFSSPMREIVGIFTHKEALEQLNGPSSAEPTDGDMILREKIVEAGNRSKSLQRTLEKEVLQLVLDRLFARDVELEMEHRPLRRGIVLGMKPHMLYVRLNEPPVEVKIHFKDLERSTGVQWRTDAHLVEAQPRQKSPFKVLWVGSEVVLRVVGHDRKRRRWLLEPAQK